MRIVDGSNAPNLSSTSELVAGKRHNVIRVIHLYIAECFPDLESNGVDIFGGWEGAFDNAEALDTADPVVIAR